MHIVKICTAGSCTRNFGLETLERAEKVLGIKAGETTPDGKFRLEKTGCLSQCELGPNVAFLSQESPLSMLFTEGHIEHHMLPSRIEAKLNQLKTE
ncbi:MAG: NAD(P)H-dependent oxidoreductase subunit E [Candidatus Gracilibacteria bacterium]|jgi:NADH:ubiquinone oxidoreductase subunit E